MCKKTWVATNAYRPKPRPSQAEGQGGEQQERDSTMKSRKAPKKFGKKHKEPGTLPRLGRGYEPHRGSLKKYATG